MARPCCVRLACAVLTTFTLIACGAHGFAQATVSSANKPSLSQPTQGPILEHALYFASSPSTQGPALPAADSSAQAPQWHRTESPASNYNVVYSVLGLGFNFPMFELNAPRPNANLAVGGTEVVQAADFAYADFSTSTGAIIPLNGLTNTPGNTVWQNLLPGSLCANHNDGELIVQYDRSAQRWILVQNVTSTSPYAVCIAISQTATFSDNMWYAYQFPVVNSGFPDYQKFAVWSTGGPSDGYFQTWNNFGPSQSGYVGPVMCGYDRAKMLAGDGTAEQICFQLPAADSSLLPADVDSPTLPPMTEDEFFIGSVGAVDNSHLSLYSMHIVDWPTGQATFTGSGNSQLLSIAAFTPACNGHYSGNCVPQPGVPPNFLQSLGDRLMYRFVYRSDFGSFSAIPVTNLTVFQQGTLVPDNNWRWMGSIAADSNNDILLGYSLSSSTVFPSIAVSGRVPSDPLGTLESEVVVVNGTHSQQGSPWGGYSSMRINPSDNCTFFYTSEYYQMDAPIDWSTQIASIKFNNCHVNNENPAPQIPSQHWYVNFDVGTPGGSNGVRWMELAPNLIPTQTAVTSLPNSSTYLEPVTITANVSPSGATGTVDFVDTFNGPPTTLCAGVPLDMNGTAMCTTPALAVGTHDQLVANYSGDSQFDGSSGIDTPPQVVNQASTSVGIVANPPSPSHLGQPVTFTATVTGQNGGSPTGTVSFLDDGNPIPGCSNVILTLQMNGSTASCLDTSLAAGSHSIVVNYVGDPNFLAGSGTIPYQVLPAVGTMTTLSVTPNPAAAGQVVNLTATVTCGLVPAPVGSVTFMSGTSNLGTVQIVSQSGTATLLDRFAPGQYQLTALYNGNSSCNSSTSLPQSLTVTGTEPTTCTLSAQPDGNNFDFTLSLFGYGFPPLAGSAPLLTQNNMLVGTIPVPGAGMSIFQPQTTYMTGSPPAGVAAADLNGDGILDLIITNYNLAGNNTFSVLLGNPDGSFQAPSPHATGLGSVGVATGDFNGDGNLDVVIANSGTNAVSVEFGDGHGGFTSEADLTTALGPVGVVVADFDRDGHADLAVTNYNVGNGNSVTVLLGNGDGTFKPAQQYTVGHGPYGIVAADFNDDGLPDLAVVNHVDGNVSILLNTGNGSFQLSNTYAVGSGPTAIVAADFKGTGVLDLAVTNSDDGTVSVLTGVGDGTFSTRVDYLIGVGPYGIVVADFNGDHRADLATANPNDNTVSILTNDGHGGFPTVQSYPVGADPIFLAAADFNGDGVPDLAVSNHGGPANTASVLLGGTASIGQLLNTHVSGNGPQNLHADFMPTGTIYGTSQCNVTVTPPAPMPTTTTLVSSQNPSNLTQRVTFTATVTSSPLPPSGAVTFTSNGMSIPECPNPVPLMLVGTLMEASCPTQSLACGRDSIRASFHDPQGLFADSSATLTQTVQGCGDFEISPITPSTLTVTQSYSSVTQPFFSTPVPVIVQGLNNYQGTVALSCSIPSLSSGTCTVSPGSVTIGSMSPGSLDTTLPPMLTVTAAAGSPIGYYMVMVTGQDQSGLVHQVSQNLTVIQNGPGVTMCPGCGGNPIVVNFPGPPSSPITPSCTLVNGTGLDGNQPLSMIGGVCTFTPATGTGPFTLVISGCEVARLHTHMPIYASLFFGLPGVVLLGSLGGGKSRRRKLLQIVGVLMLVVPMLWAVGCGGYGQLTPTGNYQVLVQGTGPDGTVYSAVVPVTVAPLH